MKLKLLTVLLIFTSVVFAKEITLNQAIEIGVINNPEMKSAQADYKSAVWQKANAISSILPSVNFSARANHTIKSAAPVFPGFPTYENSGSYGISLSQPIFTGGKIILAYKMASKNKQLKKLLLKSKIKTVVADITSKYYEAVKQTLMLNTTQEQLKIAKKNLAIALQRYSAGLISKTDLLKFQINKKNTEIALMSQKAALKLALDNLNNAIGADEEYTVSQKQKINYKKFKSPVDTLSQLSNIPKSILERCKKANNTIKISKNSLKLSLLSHKLSICNFLPMLSLSYSQNWQSQWNNLDELKSRDFDESSSYGINFSIPLFPVFNNYSNYKKSLWNYKKSKFETEKNIKSIITALKSTYWRFLTLYNRVESTEMALAYAKEAYKISEEKFKNSLISSTDLLNAEISYQNAEVNYIQTIYQFIDTKNNLRIILNFDTDEELIKFLKNSEDK